MMGAGQTDQILVRLSWGMVLPTLQVFRLYFLRHDRVVVRRAWGTEPKSGLGSCEWLGAHGGLGDSYLSPITDVFQYFSNRKCCAWVKADGGGLYPCMHQLVRKESWV